MYLYMFGIGIQIEKLYYDYEEKDLIRFRYEEWNKTRGPSQLQFHENYLNYKRIVIDYDTFTHTLEDSIENALSVMNKYYSNNHYQFSKLEVEVDTEIQHDIEKAVDKYQLPFLMIQHLNGNFQYYKSTFRTLKTLKLVFENGYSSPPINIEYLDIMLINNPQLESLKISHSSTTYTDEFPTSLIKHPSLVSFDCYFLISIKVLVNYLCNNNRLLNLKCKYLQSDDSNLYEIHNCTLERFKIVITTVKVRQILNMWKSNSALKEVFNCTPDIEYKYHTSITKLKIREDSTLDISSEPLVKLIGGLPLLQYLEYFGVLNQHDLFTEVIDQLSIHQSIEYLCLSLTSNYMIKLFKKAPPKLKYLQMFINDRTPNSTETLNILFNTICENTTITHLYLCNYSDIDNPCYGLFKLLYHKPNLQSLIMNIRYPKLLKDQIRVKLLEYYKTHLYPILPDSLNIHGINTWNLYYSSSKNLK
ncbi:hypothetical protein DLAC_02990 [Tieghemostelium lacteum]|uniref:Uncharacterized protein n=1 Tax=Tieghemostelium lacteum TaxID=361077 RepID=A0A152A4B9_TIELA|nr:hypothetical protein DLAC_02990 [Tieghemostelium lacteum]|eukprot:KYR00927.1 hypothetical protein DLAC_02990 [Tieghemostelium lacteum]